MDPGALQNLLRYLTLPRGLMTLLGWIPFYIPGRSPLHYDDEEVDKGDILKLMMNICQDKAGISFILNYLIVSRTNWTNKILSTKYFSYFLFKELANMIEVDQLEEKNLGGNSGRLYPFI